MKGKKRFLRRSVLSDPHLWIAFVVAAVFIVMELLGVVHALRPELSLHVGLTVIVICIITLAADRLRGGEQGREDSEKLGRIADSAFGRTVTLRDRPSEETDYDYLWGGYTGSYSVYNPAYLVDDITGYDKIVRILVRRYQNPDFKEARYVFLTGDDDGKDSLQRFRRLMALVHKKYPALDEKVEVKVLEAEKASSMPEMYLGSRYGKKMAVLELREPTGNPRHGMPHYYLVVHDQRVCEHYLQDHFEPAWAAAKKTPLSE